MKSSNRTLSSRRQRRWFIWVVVFMLLLSGGGAAWYFLLGPASAQARMSPGALAQTFTTPVKRGDLTIGAAGSGKLVAHQSVDLSFSTSGTVAQLNVVLGDMVKAGQVLASLGSSQTLEANVTAAKLQVLEAQKTLDDLQENGDLSLAQAYSDLVKAQEAYTAALNKSQRVDNERCGQDVRTRYKAALDRAVQELENIKAEQPGSDVYIAAKKSYDTALANYTYCISYTSNEKDSTQSALEVAKTTLEAAQQTYDTLKAAAGIDPNALAMAEANLKKAQAQWSKAQDELAGITLTAPMDGKVTYLASQEGALVGSSKFITIVDVSHSTLEISVDESDLERLVVGSEASVSFDALPDQSFSGKIVQVYPEITVSGTYRVARGLVELDSSAVNILSTLPLGLSASVTITNQEAKNVLLVPVIALKDLGDNTYSVMVQGSDGKLKMQVVTVGLQDGEYAVITSGLKDGDVVSTGATRFIAAGSTDSSDALKNAQNSGGFPGGGGMPPIP